MIRKAEIEDVPYIIETGMRLLAKTRHDDVPAHKPTIFRVMQHFVRAHDKFFIISERDEIVRGLLMASIESFWWDDPARGRRYVTDWAFYSEHRGDGLLMLKAMQEWAWMQPRVVEVACATNVPKGRNVVDRLFDQAGFDRVGGRYTIPKPVEGHGTD